MTVLWQGIPRHRATRNQPTKRIVELLPGDIVLREATPVYFSGGQLHSRRPKPWPSDADYIAADMLVKRIEKEIADNDG